MQIKELLIQTMDFVVGVIQGRTTPTPPKMPFMMSNWPNKSMKKTLTHKRGEDVICVVGLTMIVVTFQKNNAESVW